MPRMNDHGIAYGFLMIVAFLAVAGLLYAVFSPVVNQITSQVNNDIASGDMSLQTQKSIQWNVGGFVFSIIITLIGGIYWVVIRAQEQKKYGS